MENSKKNNILAVLCLLCALILGIVSSSLTAGLFYSLTDGVFGYLMVLVGLCLDFGKFAFPAHAAYCFIKEKYISTIVYGVLALCCILVSFFASMAFDLNSNNKIKNETVTSSSAYKRQENLFNSANKSIEQLRADLADLKANKNKTIESSVQGLKSQKNALPNAYITKKNQIQSQIDAKSEKTKKSIEAEITSKENELKAKEAELTKTNTGFSEVGKNLSTTKGIYSLAQWLDPKDPDGMIGTMNLIKNILTEIVAIAFAMAFGTVVGKSNYSFKDAIGKIKDKFKSNKEASNVVTANNSHKIGFEYSEQKQPIKQNTNQIDKSIIEKYKVYMFDNAIKNNDKLISRGHKHIAEAIGIEPELGRKVKGHLEQTGIIETIGNRTFIRAHE